MTIEELAAFQEAVKTLVRGLGDVCAVLNKMQPADPAPSAEYLLGYSSAVLRAARNRAEEAYRAVMDDCGDTRKAHYHAMDAVWPLHRSPKTRDELDRWTLEAQKEADEWSGMKRPVNLTKPDGLMHAEPSNDPRTLGKRLNLNTREE